MADYVNAKLPNRVIPLTKDCDAKITIRRGTTLVPEDWGSVSVYMLIDIDKANPTKIDATIVDSLATVVIEAATANTCKTGTTWRVVLSTPGTPSFERPLLLGTFERNDGK
jgi:hypothetical protein